MKFGSVPVEHSVGGVVAHTLRREGLVLKKGEIIGEPSVVALKAAGVDTIVVARLEAGDMGEDAAASLLAGAVGGENLRVERPFTGRSNLFAEKSGVLLLDTTALDRVNDIDERVTIATLPAFRAVVTGEMVATVKIIPFAVPGEIVSRARAAATAVGLRVAAYNPMRVGVISTLLPGLKASVVAKTLRVLGERLAPSGAAIAFETRVDHDRNTLAAEIRRMAPECDLLIVFGASAITDRRDVIPAALEAAGGVIEQFGMPVDPGNLLLLGALGDGNQRKAVLGAPGCARSPKENGFDWVLQRLLAGVHVGAADIRRLGAGGLLMEIISRGQPRAGQGAEDDARGDHE